MATEAVPSFSHDTSMELLHAALVEHGCVLVKEVVSPAEASTARTQLDLLEPIHWDILGNTEHYKNVFNRDPYWLRFIDQLPIIALAEAILGKDCHIIGQTAWKSHPGHRGVGLHLDYLPFELNNSELQADFDVPPLLATAHFYLCDVTIDLCPTYVIPGSQRAFRKPTKFETSWNGRRPLPVLCGAGDVLFFRSDLWHSGSDNITRDRTRYLLQVHYGRREMANHFAPYLQWRFNREVIAAATERQLRLLGDHTRGAYD